MRIVGLYQTVITVKPSISGSGVSYLSRLPRRKTLKIAVLLNAIYRMLFNPSKYDHRIDSPVAVSFKHRNLSAYTNVFSIEPMQGKMSDKSLPQLRDFIRTQTDSIAAKPIIFNYL